ncbi:response regulator transcription factor [Cytobacillus purgationiresistens]|uniref:DNA-binding response OmpR family regulator n=1 Tax=Cytobacillus purgationiresistens TaxID=863449 RepID=A0ABU0AKX2_9BACI|nr:response regulator transcription factor [Cytobacillus purgationiresistens]MDQ0271916.1 DNA-binding response OmpR family regulator [Cytobacillus purgationiresistens]
MEKPRILIVDDESDLCHLIKTALVKEGFTDIEMAGSVHEGWEKFKAFSPNIAILDVMLPDGEGYDLCNKIREISRIPVLFLSAKSDEVDKILGLAIGGDDYITKPFSPKEVAFRVKAQFRRAGLYTMEVPAQPNASETISVGPFSINNDETEVMRNGKLLELTAKEVGLMACFMRNPNRILSKETLFERVWGEDFYGADNTLMVHIRRLREKIEDTPSKPAFIITVKGLGYKFIAK